ncbi:hypothetical protein [Microvirga solisilvae]|uniref:hypothetical protein n=1 Tax=Microvirga solisilvae TaxID=2919498 RepID=UPI001FAF9C03|nr:hypothetical protein [Microvirga solisilvae]
MDGVTQKRIAFGGIEVTVPPPWHDITDEVEVDNAPYTLADSEGVGALQFSIALYEGGAVPDPSQEKLRDMALKFGEDRNLGDPFEESLFTHEALRGAGMNYQWGDDFIRVWYVSDGRSFAFVTYCCEWEHQRREVSLCEDIVKSLRFVPR